MSKKSKNIFFILSFVGSIVLFPLFCSPLLKADEVLVDLAKKVRPAVVLIKTFDENNKPMGQGSGFFISTQGHLITNYHVVEGAYSANIITMAGKTYPVKGIMAKDVEGDVAKLLIDVPDSEIPVLELANVLPSVGEDIAVVGNPLGLESTVSRGIVSAIREIPIFGNIVQISAPISPGSSGSPVLNMKGQVIGVATFILREGQALNFAVPSAKILDLKPDDKLTSLQKYFGELIAKRTETTEANVVEKACELIYQGRFNAASELIKHFSQSQQSQLAQLADIVAEYSDMNQQRQTGRKAAYQKQLDELEKFQAGTDANDVNDVNDIISVLSVIAKASEFADEQQKDELLSELFIKEVFQRAMDKAAEFESEGKWLDAYITCYSWLQAIDKDNKRYSDYAEQLLEKANIVASFQDSPCETRKERYEGVKKEMFFRAINSLDLNYVSTIDYRQMTTKAIKRCRLLAEVMRASFSQIEQSAVGASLGDNCLSRPDSHKIAAWSSGLSDIQEEVDASALGMRKKQFTDVCEKVLELNTKTVQLPRSLLIVQFAEAGLSALDRYTTMVWPRQVQDFVKIMTNEFTGIGIEISKQKGLLTVASLLPDTPAYYSGLDADDVIGAVDDVPTKDMSLGCAVKNITGPAGTKVRLTIRRPGREEPFDITITRAKIIVPTIRGWQRTKTGGWLYMIDNREKIGYVRLTSFSEKTAGDFERVLGELEAEGLRGLILDLRFNSGGLLDSAIKITDLFIKEGLIVSRQPGRGFASYAMAHKRGTRSNYPLVILINSYSASASEIVAGALADKAHDRAILVGERTHGKGSVQEIIHYPEGGQLKYTMAYYHLPSGQRVKSREAMKEQGKKDWGVGPDIEIKLRSDELKKRFDVQRDNDVLAKADHESSGMTELVKHSAEKTLAADPQLAVGVVVVKTNLIEESVKPKAKNVKPRFRILNFEL